MDVKPKWVYEFKPTLKFLVQDNINLSTTKEFNVPPMINDIIKLKINDKVIKYRVISREIYGEEFMLAGRLEVIKRY